MAVGRGVNLLSWYKEIKNKKAKVVIQVIIQTIKCYTEFAAFISISIPPKSSKDPASNSSGGESCSI